TFIGPPPQVIELLGDKLAARRMMQQAGVPTVPGSEEPMYRVDDAVDVAREIGYPLMIKAVAGGGGRGIRPVSDEKDLLRQLPLAHMDTQSFFGDGALYLERRVVNAHHVKVQLLADAPGTPLALGERDCTL